jgi:5S rRNA maturation endonuclease (ribonuclease M5)
MELKKIKKILNDNVETVFSNLNMEYEIISDNIYSTCPVHDGSDNNRAFSFSRDKGIWKCWTRDCQHSYKNDIFGLIQGALSQQCGREVDFKYVLSWCYSTFNLKYEHHNKTTERPDDDTDELFYNIVSTFSVDKKLAEEKPIEKTFTSKCPSSYFYDRGFKNKTLKYFGVGDCDESGIMKERSVIPIHDDDGKSIVGYIGRSTKVYRTPKFLLYPKGFDKRRYLYNYHRAKKRAIETSCIYLLEGQGDVWRLYESGVQNAISIFGKTLSEEQEYKIRKLGVTHIIVMLDGDQAGREAKLQIHRQLNRMYKLTFPKIQKKDIGEMNIKDIRENILSTLRGTY